MTLTKILCALPLLLCACTQTSPTIVNERPIMTKLEGREIVLNGDNDLKTAADEWKRGGQGPVEVIATYSDGDGNRGLAQSNASSAAERLRRLGVENVTVQTLPASNTTVIAHMTTLTAGADPASCGTPMPGMTSSINAYDYGDYRLGCGVDEMFSRQIAHTEDLEGRAPGQGYANASDAQRAGNIVDTYRKGEPNEPLEGLAASDIAGREN